ncbi:MAG: phytanoyl-CoA dioxygenase family protein [Chitinophagales bacterium]|nr:phytanoyl-CoA dioxygenase family protein [Chitinophagales bacterium]
MEWTPIKHKIVLNENHRDILHNKGYLIDGNIGLESIKKLESIYNKYHKVKTKKGGMFYSLYSLDLDYRKKVHEEIEAILNVEFKKRFSDYKSVINSFIVKYNGEESAFTLHQDSTSLDEEKYSPLSVWIPLQDTNLENGCLCVIPQSHKIFYPYRGISFSTPFHKIENTLRKYLVPIEMKAGDILLFDNRMVHYSPENNSKKPRLVVMSGLFPKEASLQNCYKELSPKDAPLEIYEQAEDFLLTNTTFFHDCTSRPIVGKKIKEIKLELPEFSAEDFENRAAQLGLEKPEFSKLCNSGQAMHIVSEPDEQKGSLLSFIKETFN